MIDMRVLGLTLDGATRAPILVLKAARGEDILPLWIGGIEAMSISLALGKATAERPLAHDLMTTLLHSLGVSLIGVSIVDVRDGVFYAMLDLVRGTEMLQIDCRPSDGIALALRMHAPIRVTDAVLAQAPRERYQAAMAGRAMPPDEAETIVLRTLKQVEGMRIASGGSAAPETPEPHTRIVGAPDEDVFAKLLRDLEPASKNRM